MDRKQSRPTRICRFEQFRSQLGADNLASLQRQKFAESLENAFISSASDFYGVLNRMSAEPDFKRLLTEFALGESSKEDCSHPMSQWTQSLR
jgi:hypothetical protein